MCDLSRGFEKLVLRVSMEIEFNEIEERLQANKVREYDGSGSDFVRDC